MNKKRVRNYETQDRLLLTEMNENPKLQIYLDLFYRLNAIFNICFIIKQILIL
jgi:hypothetical protein